MADGVGDNKPNLFNPKRQNGGNTKDKETKSLVNYPTPSQKDWKPPARTGGRCICCCWQQNVGQLFFCQGVVDDGFGQQDLDDDDDKDGFDVLQG